MTLQIEQQEAGFSATEDPGRLVCPQCIADEGLRLFVSRLQHIGEDRCGFCGGPGPHGIELHELFRYMAACLAAEWGDPYGQVYLDQDDGSYVGVYPMASNELLWEVGEPLAGCVKPDWPHRAHLIWPRLGYATCARIPEAGLGSVGNEPERPGNEGSAPRWASPGVSFADRRMTRSRLAQLGSPQALDGLSTGTP